MKVKKLIKELKEYNKEAEVTVIVHCKDYGFSIVYGGSEGIAKENCDLVSLYVDELCTGEQCN